ncbi:MAG: hypothetical protein C4289_08055, partial [Chloroflexota bacterium]
MARMYYDQDADLGLLQGKKIAVLGYGSQGHAHALNLKDSGCDVLVGLYRGSKSWPEAEKAGLEVAETAEAVRRADMIMVLVPDQVQRQLYLESIAPNLKPGKTLMFAHGFNIHFSQIVPPPEIDVSMVAPKGPGHLVRSVFLEGDAARFPTEVCDFSALSTPDALWYLEVDQPLDIDAAFLGSVRLILNSSHPVVRKMLADPSVPELTVLRW